MIKELLLVHHTHTDIGYTHPQPAVFELHHRFIEMALNLAEESSEERDDAKFRWTCEVTGTTRAWWNQASSRDQERFLSAVRRGQFEIAALEWHLTPLADLRMLIRSLENVRFFREVGIPVRSAMNTDVNGVPWGLVDVLLDHGIDGFSMSANSHFGAPVYPRPGAFKWSSPSGRELLVWNGFQYWHAANVLLHMPNSISETKKALPPFLAEAERRGYPLSYLPLQITNPHHPDNATPDRSLGEFVKAWNDRDPEIKIRTVLLTEIFDRLRKETLPLQNGDWTDYWNFGAGSSTRETSVFLEGLRVLDAAHQASTWFAEPLPRQNAHLDAAHRDLGLYAEHTWGADCSISSPESIETKIQWSMKSACAYQGLSHARIVLRDGLAKLATQAGGEDPTLLLYNPLSVPFKSPMLLPVKNLDWALTAGIHHLQRLDGALGNLGDDAMRWCDIEVPALGYRTFPISELTYSSSKGLIHQGLTISSDRLRVEFHESGGIKSLQLDGKEFAGESGEFVFGVPILERPAGGSRREIMKLDFSRFEPADGWQENWERTISRGKLIDAHGRLIEGAVEFCQMFELENSDCVQVVYRLFANRPNVEIETILDSSGDTSPYSIAIPFVLPEANETTWHFDTAGAVVEFDREQLPNAARHFVTTRRFIRMQTSTSAFTFTTPDLPLWKFGGMFFAPSSQLKSSNRKAVALAWLANNYWEVNFLANQSGRSRSRFNLIPHEPEPVHQSYLRALPHTCPPRVHAYRGNGPVANSEETLFTIESNRAVLDVTYPLEDDLIFVFQNLVDDVTAVAINFQFLPIKEVWRSDLKGDLISQLGPTENGIWGFKIEPRALAAFRVKQG